MKKREKKIFFFFSSSMYMIRTGFGLNCAHISHCFAEVYHNAISELCKGLHHHTGVCHESKRPQIRRFRPQARVPPLGVRYAFLTNAAASHGEVSVWERCE